jgi:hypothetical protein
MGNSRHQLALVYLGRAAGDLPLPLLTHRMPVQGGYTLVHDESCNEVAL